MLLCSLVAHVAVQLVCNACLLLPDTALDTQLSSHARAGGGGAAMAQPQWPSADTCKSSITLTNSGCCRIGQ